MRLIWSHAVQTSSCRRYACFHSATKLARRPTTSASKRRLKVSDVFTLCYSAMFATAAVVDAKRKERRRKQWDQAIAQAKAGDSAASTTESAAALEWAQKESRMKPSTIRPTHNATATAVLSASEQRLRSSEFLPPDLDDLRLELSQMNKDDSFDTQLRNMNAHLEGTFVENGVTDEEWDEFARGEPFPTLGPRRSNWVPRREPMTMTHLDRMEDMVLRLVRNLVSSTKILSPETAGSQQRPIENSRDQLPKYAPLNYRIERERAALNTSIEAILTENSPDNNSIDVMVAKICYALLTSRAPPSIVTYYIMITHFTRLQQHHNSQAVIDSFFHDSLFRPDSRTISAILDHYTSARDKEGFLYVMKRMRATDGDMRINRLHMSHIKNPGCQVWAHKWKVTHHNGFLYAKVYRDSIIYESLINGVLHFFGIRWAAIYLGFAFREGYDISMELLIRLARTCLSEKNKRAAAKILSTIVSRWHQHGSLILDSNSLESNALVRKCMYQLLHLCGIWPSKVIESHQSLPDGFPDSRALRPWLYCLRTESIDREFTGLAKAISNLHIIVSKYLSDRPNRQLTLSLLQCHVKRWPFDSILRRRDRAILQSYFEAVARHAIAAEDLRRQIIDVVYEALSHHSQRIHDGLMKGLPALDSPENLKIIVDLRSNGRDISRGSSHGGSVITEYASENPPIELESQIPLLPIFA